MSKDKVSVHISESEVRPGILDRQVENCPTCDIALTSGFGPYGYFETCGRVVWKCVVPDDIS